MPLSWLPPLQPGVDYLASYDQRTFCLNRSLFISTSTHTRSWINWEVGVGAAKGRGIWVFEPHPMNCEIPKEC